MAYSPISSVPIQYSKADGTPANGYYLKFYLANSSTPISMQTDSGGATSLAKCKLNESGYPISNPNDENTVFIPHLNTTYTAYRFVLYASAADADANNVTSGLPNIQSVKANKEKVEVDALRAELAAGNGGSLMGFIQDGSGAVAIDFFKMAKSFLSAVQFGCVGDDSTDNTSAFSALMSHINSIPLSGRPIGIYIPNGTYRTSQPLWFERPVHIFGQGATIRITGSADAAIKIGPDDLTGYDVFYQGEYTVEGLRFTGGSNANFGILIHDWIIEPRIRDCVFIDYGNDTSYDIYGFANIWDCIIENCRKFALDSATATGNFISITGVSRVGSVSDGGNSRTTIRDCWMTAYQGQEMGYFAYVDAIKCRIVGGGFQRSSRGIILGPLASATTIDTVYAEIDTPSNPNYVTVFDKVEGGNYYYPQNVTIKNAYVNLHEGDIGSAGRLIAKNSTNSKIKNWTLEDITITGFVNGHILIDQNDTSGQTGNFYRNIKTVNVPANVSSGWSFLIRSAGYINAEFWACGDSSEGNWTPVDGSGAGLTFSSGTTGRYQKIGNILYFTCSIRFPVTASTDFAIIGGLPIAMAATPDGAQGGSNVNYTNYTTGVIFKPDNGSSQLIVRQMLGGSQLTNADVSNKRFDVSGFYFVS